MHIEQDSPAQFSANFRSEARADSCDRAFAKRFWIAARQISRTTLHAHRFMHACATCRVGLARSQTSPDRFESTQSLKNPVTKKLTCCAPTFRFDSGRANVARRVQRSLTTPSACTRSLTVQHRSWRANDAWHRAEIFRRHLQGREMASGKLTADHPQLLNCTRTARLNRLAVRQCAENKGENLSGTYVALQPLLYKCCK